MFLILAVAILGLAAYLAAEAATLSTRQRVLSLRRAASYGRTRGGAERGTEPFKERVLAPLEQKLARIALRVTPSASVEAVAAKLLGAGVSRSISPQQFMAAKGAAAIGAFLFGALLGLSGGAGTAFLLALVFGGAAFLLPDFVLKTKASRRREEIRAALPDALDLLTVSVEAGLGFDGALTKLTEHMTGPLADEFAITLGQMRVGENRQDALKAMADRVEAAEISAFVRSIIQSDQLGMSLGRILKAQATDARNRRQMAAEEKAMKAPVKMLIPTALFIFPAMFIVILGPAVIGLLEMF